MDVAIYARLSVSKDESVSIERQLRSARLHADSRGWTVVLEAVDDGVSAGSVKPEDRLGWQRILQSKEQFQAVVVWKVDRLARRTLDFLHADQALQARGAAICSVEDSIDMTTPTGRAFATMLAVFAEIEIEEMRVRATASREAILRLGRRPGGRPPFGWMNVPNPSGAGKVLAKDPERIGYVVELAGRALRGDSLYSMARWLEQQGVGPRPRAKAKPVSTSGAVWHDASVEAILRSPSLAGMVAYRGGVIQGEDGLPIIDESVAIVTPSERRQLLALIDKNKRPGTRPRSGYSTALLYGLVRCGSCDGLLYRATAASKYQQYRCQQRGCPKRVGISRPAIEKHVVDSFLERKGSELRIVSKEVTPKGDAVRLMEIEAAIVETTADMQKDDVDEVALQERLFALKKERRAARESDTHPERTFKVTGDTVGKVWRSSEGDTDRQRDLLMEGLDAVKVGVGGGRGRTFDPTRVQLIWKQLSDEDAARLEHQRNMLSMRAWDHLPQASAEELAEWQRQSDERSRS